MNKLANSASAIAIASLLSSLALAGDAAPATPPSAPQPASANLNTGFISITRMHVTTQKRDGEWTADVTCHITLNGVPHVPYTFSAALVDDEGNVHTNKRGVPYSASREVATGEWNDTDKYTVTIPLAGLYTSRAPALFVRAQILDSSKKVVTSSIPQPFTPPKD